MSVRASVRVCMYAGVYTCLCDLREMPVLGSMYGACVPHPGAPERCPLLLLLSRC